MTDEEAGEPYGVRVERDGLRKRTKVEVEPLDILAAFAGLVCLVVVVSMALGAIPLNWLSAGMVTGLLGAAAIGAYAGKKQRAKKKRTSR